MNRNIIFYIAVCVLSFFVFYFLFNLSSPADTSVFSVFAVSFLSNIIFAAFFAAPFFSFLNARKSEINISFRNKYRIVKDGNGAFHIQMFNFLSWENVELRGDISFSSLESATSFLNERIEKSLSDYEFERNKKKVKELDIIGPIKLRDPCFEEMLEKYYSHDVDEFLERLEKFKNKKNKESER